MKQPVISIIITVLNGAMTINDTLLSIECQTVSDYELIIVDGGSEDDTVSIAKASTIVNKIVKVIPGAGLYAGLNAGVKLASGSWLYFMGADDKIHQRDTLENVINFIMNKRKETRVLVGNVNCVKQGNVLYPMFGSPYLMRYQSHHQGMFYDRSLFNNMLYDETKRIASDYGFNLRLALLSIPHEAINIVTCDFGGDGVSEKQLKRGYEEMQQIHKELFSGLSQKWIVNYFWIRRRTGSMLRRYDLFKIRAAIKYLLG